MAGSLLDTMDSSRYYDQHAQQFFDRTHAVSMEAFYAPFLALIPAGGHILDAGCGSGRDAKEFLARGYQVTAFDAARHMAALASRHAGIPVQVMRFEDITFNREFDGVWTCASLLHVSRAKMPDVFRRVATSLKPGGVWYMSFKYGDGDSIRDGRMFTNYDEPGLRHLLGAFPELSIVSMSTSGDVRSDRENEQWLNVIVQSKTD